MTPVVDDAELARRAAQLARVQARGGYADDECLSITFGENTWLYAEMQRLRAAQGDGERVTLELNQLRYQLGHEADREQETLDALRLCRATIVADHCPGCRAAAALADMILAQRDAERSPA